MGLGGVALKVFSTMLRALQFLAAIAILGIFSYFLVYLRDHHIDILTWVRAVEGLSGAAALYTLIAFFLTCCLGGLPFFAFVAIVLDIAFVGCFVAVTILTRGGNTNCSALGPNDDGIYNDNGLYNNETVVNVNTDDAKRICIMYKTTFALAIIEIGLFLISALFQLFLGRHHQREKREAAYAAPVGGRRRFWGRRRHVNKTREMEHGAVPVTANY